MGRQCKICKSLSPTKRNPLKHYRLQQAIFYLSIPSHVYMTDALAHLKRRVPYANIYHVTLEILQPGIISTFKCLVYNACWSTEKDYFQHIGNYLKSHKTVFCVFEGCNFHTKYIQYISETQKQKTQFLFFE